MASLRRRISHVIDVGLVRLCFGTAESMYAAWLVLTLRGWENGVGGDPTHRRLELGSVFVV